MLQTTTAKSNPPAAIELDSAINSVSYCIRKIGGVHTAWQMGNMQHTDFSRWGPHHFVAPPGALGLEQQQ
jgi:hypothetical protein